MAQSFFFNNKAELNVSNPRTCYLLRNPLLCFRHKKRKAKTFPEYS